MHKKYKSKWTRIAVAGATTDGRKILPEWIEQMAEQYNPETYTARVNCEHIKTLLPSGEFGAYGKVAALKAEEAEIGGQKKLALYGQVIPNEELIELNKKDQKIFTSIEISPEFADTGKAYLVGLAVTDSPASLGTEALVFSAKSGMLNNRKQNESNLFTAAEETKFEFIEEAQPAAASESFFSELKATLAELLKLNASPAAAQPEAAPQPATPSPVEANSSQALAEKFTSQLTQLGNSYAQLSSSLATAQQEIAQLTTQLAAQKTELASLSQDFANTPASPGRPAITGQAANLASF